MSKQVIFFFFTYRLKDNMTFRNLSSMGLNCSHNVMVFTFYSLHDCIATTIAAFVCNCHCLGPLETSVLCNVWF